jgi:16S rRNA (uracil1498-N3)-methyltransferase
MSDGFFLADLPAGVGVGDVVRLTGREAHHAAVVRRIRPGEVVTVADGQGQGVLGPVLRASAAEVAVEVAQTLVDPPPRPRITIVQALPKRDRADLAVDLMTELGVDSIIPWQASRSVVRWHGERGEKARSGWQMTAREAAKQSRRLTVPVVADLATTGEVADYLAASACPLVMHEVATTPIRELVLDRAVPVVCVIGPEGGIAPAELEAFVEAGARPYRMGSTVLRTSTAGAVAVTQLRLLADLADRLVEGHAVWPSSQTRPADDERDHD